MMIQTNRRGFMGAGIMLLSTSYSCCHCERSEAIHIRHESGLLRHYAPRNDENIAPLNGIMAVSKIELQGNLTALI
jgi:hypothetical protein